MLGPFPPLRDLDAEARELVAEVLARHTSFAYRLEEIATFPDGTIHLRPDPMEPFAALTAALWEAFPAYPPYAGRHLDLTPHVTLDMTVTGATEQSLRAQLGRDLPHWCVADAVVLSWYAAGRAAPSIAGRWPRRDAIARAGRVARAGPEVFCSVPETSKGAATKPTEGRDHVEAREGLGPANRAVTGADAAVPVVRRRVLLQEESRQDSPVGFHQPPDDTDDLPALPVRPALLRLELDLRPRLKDCRGS